jgi:hypothetical protein
MLRRIVPAAAAAMLLLSGCVSAPEEPSPTTAVAEPSAEPTSTATSEPTPVEQPQAETVIVTAESITVASDDGSPLAEFDYFQPTDEVVDGLTEAFGVEPTDERFEGAIEAPPATVWTWDGFELRDPDPAGEPPFWVNHWVRVGAAEVNGVAVETVDGVRVGDDAQTIEARYPDTSDRVTAGDEPERLDVYLGAIPLPQEGENSDGNYEFSVWLIAKDPSAEISEFRAPSPNFGV